jgi:predicted nuclease of predicted toxin-antitoxin system
VRFFLDHDVPADLALLLRSRGHDAVRLSEVLPVDTPDEAAWAWACADSRIVMTCNRQHFLALAAATEMHPGLIVLNRRRTRVAEMSHVLALLANAGPEGLDNNINFA